MLIRGVHAPLMAPDAPAGGGGGDAPKPPDGAKPAAPENTSTSEKVRLANELAATKARLADLERAATERANADAAADEERKKKLKDEGDLKKIHEEALKDLEKAKQKLAEVDADVKLGRSARETYSKQVTDAKAKLTDAQKSIVESLERHDVVQAANAAAEFIAANARSTTQPALPPGGGPPPPPGANEQNVDIGRLIQDGETAAVLATKYPAAYAKWAEGFGAKKNVTSISSWFQKKKPA